MRSGGGGWDNMYWRCIPTGQNSLLNVHTHIGIRSRMFDGVYTAAEHCSSSTEPPKKCKHIAIAKKRQQLRITKTLQIFFLSTVSSARFVAVSEENKIHYVIDLFSRLQNVGISIAVRSVEFD